MGRLGTSRERYRTFVGRYNRQQLDEASEPNESNDVLTPESRRRKQQKRREYLRDYLRWLWPHRFAVAGVFGLALLSAGLEMILFLMALQRANRRTQQTRVDVNYLGALLYDQQPIARA